MLSLLTRRLVSKQAVSLVRDARTFLSSAYTCQELWEQRRKNPIFQKIDYDDLYHQLDRSFLVGSRVSVLDIDLFVNGLNDDFFQNELEDVLFKLRSNPETSLLSPRTMHAVIKYYIAINKKRDLVSILSNRLNFGIFPDYYLANVLMDQFLKEGDVVSAAKIAVLHMLQEDFNHPILNNLSILCCYKYLFSPEVWAPPKEPEVDPDEDEVRVRVKFVRTPYFDDHFDLIDTNHLLGKTLHMVGQSTLGPLGLSSQIVGLSLYEKWSELNTLLTEIVRNKSEVYQEALQKAEEYVQTRPKQLEGTPAVLGNEDSLEKKKQVLGSMENVRKSCKLLDGNLEKIAEEEVIKVVSENESKDISALSQLYREWEKERENHIQLELYESEKRKVTQEIDKTRQELQSQEQVIFFFDKEDEWELKVEEKEAEQRALAEKEASRKKKSVEEEYIPPDVDARKA